MSLCPAIAPRHHLAAGPSRAVTNCAASIAATAMKHTTSGSGWRPLACRSLLAKCRRSPTSRCSTARTSHMLAVAPSGRLARDLSLAIHCYRSANPSASAKHRLPLPRCSLRAKQPRSHLAPYGCWFTIARGRLERLVATDVRDKNCLS